MKKDAYKSLERVIICELNPSIYYIENDTQDYFYHDDFDEGYDKRSYKKQKSHHHANISREKDQGYDSEEHEKKYFMQSPLTSVGDAGGGACSQESISSYNDNSHEKIKQKHAETNVNDDSDDCDSEWCNRQIDECKSSKSQVAATTDKSAIYLDNIKHYFEKSGKRKGKTKERLRIHQEKMETFSQKFEIPRYDAPYWVYLMSVDDSVYDHHHHHHHHHHRHRQGDKSPRSNEKFTGIPLSVKQKTLTHIGKARDPMAKVHMHNERLLSSKSTRAASGLWKLEIVIGPFFDKETTVPIREFWKKKRRGSDSRRRLGKWIASTLGLECYDSRIKG